MVNTASLFSQVLHLVSHLQFQEQVVELKAERYAKGLSCWQQFVAMMFCQLAQARSLREICGGLSLCEGKLVHLGIKQAPKRSTLAYANQKRPWQLYQKVFYQLLEKYRSLPNLSGHKLRFRNPLLSLDSTTVDLCLSVFPWADFMRTKGAVKLHLLLDHQGYMPAFALITTGKISDIEVARNLELAPGSIVVFDRAYKDYALWARLCERKVFFVTRTVKGTKYQVVKALPLPKAGNILADEVIQLSSKHAKQQGCTAKLRRVEVWVEQKGEKLTLLTNHLTLAATTIARIYQERWQIEVFFKSLKQHLRIKSFVGTTPNAIHIQIWTALIALLLLKYLKAWSRCSWSLSNLVAFLGMSLFTYRDLMGWLKTSFEGPALVPKPVQLELGDSGQHKG